MRWRPLWTTGGVLASAGLLASSFDAPQPDPALHRLVTFEEKKTRARLEIVRAMARDGIPGLTIGVSIDGRRVWSEGFGYSDTPCRADTRMRIASISKPFASTIAARLVDEGRLDIDVPIQKYLPDYPEKKLDGKKVEITTRQLLSHTSGTRHYPENDEKKGSFEDSSEWDLHRASSEFLSNKPYKTVTEALEMFKNDPLNFEPGSKFSYTTHGFTLVSAVLEKAAGKTYPVLLEELLQKLGMLRTGLDRNGPITANRAKYYYRNKKHVLENVPEVDCSYKWAGGGVLSCVDDLLIFANAILYSAQIGDVDGAVPPPLISPSTLHNFWKGEVNVESANGRERMKAALGWFRVPSPRQVGGADGVQADGGYWYHTGGAVGASSVLLLRPNVSKEEDIYAAGPPKGVCVAVLCNLHATSVLKLAVEIERIFRES